MHVEAVEPTARHVSVVAIPEASASTLYGINDVLNSFSSMKLTDVSPFRVEIVGEATGPLEVASGLPVTVQRRRQRHVN